MARTTLNRMEITPITVTICKGRVLKEVALDMAYFIRLQKDHLLWPNCRSCTSYCTVSVRKPAQKLKARKNVLRSGRARSTSTTFRSNSLKSEEAFMSILISLLIIL